MTDEVSFTLNKNQIIEMSFALLCTYTGKTPIPSWDFTIAGYFLNSMIKFWQQTNKAQIITRRTGYVFLEPGQTTYTLTSTSNDHATYAYVQTDTTVAQNLGDTNLTVQSVVGININDKVGVVGATTGNLIWATVTNIVGSVLTISPALTDSVLNEATVFTYTTPMNSPIMIHRAWRTDTSSSLDVPIKTLSSNDYGDIPTKNLSGIVTAYWYEPGTTNGNESGLLHVWQAPQDPTEILTISFTHEVDDYDLATDTSDFNSGWYLVLAYSLAAYLAPIYGKHQELQTLAPAAQMLFKAMCSADSERGELRLIR